MSSVFLNIPILNEVRNIGALLDGIQRQLVGHDYTILLIDDGSTDGTLDIVAKLQDSDPRVKVLSRVKTKPGCQRGGALVAGMRWGLENTSHSIFVEMDGDLSHLPEELPIGIALTERPDVDFVIGSKYLRSSMTVDREFTRQSISSLCNLLIRASINRVITDYSNGYRFYTRNVAVTLSKHTMRYTTPIYLSEALAIVLSHGFRIAEYPSTYVGRIEGQSKVRLSDLIEGLVALVNISYRYHWGEFTQYGASSRHTIQPDNWKSVRAPSDI